MIILSVKKIGAIFSFVVVFRGIVFFYCIFSILYCIFELLLPGAEIKVYKNSNIFLSFFVFIFICFEKISIMTKVKIS